MDVPSYAARIDLRTKTKAYLSWFSERFPFLNIVSSYLLFFFMFVCSTYGEGVYLNTKSLLLPMGVLTQLLLLRILDEFKDHAYDKEHHPDRVLQKGILKLSDLKILAVGAFLIQLFLNLKWGTVLNPWWLAMSLWTVLMTKEFFIGEWLRKRVFLYLVSHMIVMVFLSYWILSFYAVSETLKFSVVSLIFAGSVLYELSRKTRGLDEDKRLDSYPKEIGFGANTVLLCLVSGSVILLKAYILHSLSISLHWIYLWDVLAAVVFFVSIANVQFKKSQKSRKILEANYGGLMFAVYLSLILHVFIWS